MKKIIFCLAFLNLCLLSQWVNQNVTPHPPPINSVYSFSSDIGFAAADSGKILRTTNAGANWNTNTVAQFFPFPVYSIHVLTQNNLLCICNAPGNGRIFRSTDGGVNWILSLNRTGGILYSLKFLNAATGYVYGQPAAMQWFTARTTDAGLTWDTTISRPPADSPTDIGFPNSMNVLFNGQTNIWFGASNGKIYHSPNGALNWTFGTTGPGQAVLTISYIDQLNGYSGGQFAYKTISGNNGWSQQNYPNTGPFYSFAALSGRIWYSSGPTIFYSSNGGANFIPQHTSPDGSHYRHLSLSFTASDNQMSVLTGWGVTSNGIISRYDEFVGIKHIGTNVPENFKLEQNYPNPFNPTTYINFSLPSEGGAMSVKLIIYNILGENIATLLDKELKPGNYSADWDASDYPSGVYYYRLTSGKYSDTKKMILVK